MDKQQAQQLIRQHCEQFMNKQGFTNTDDVKYALELAIKEMADNEAVRNKLQQLLNCFNHSYTN